MRSCSDLSFTGIRPQVIDEIRALAKKHDVELVVLYGSRARGDQWERSDIDLAYRGGDGVRFALDVDEETSTLLMYDTVDLDRPNNPDFLAEIERDGVILYEKG